MTRRHIDIPDELWRQVAIAAAERGKTKRQVVVDAIEFLLMSIQVCSELLKERDGERYIEDGDIGLAVKSLLGNLGYLSKEID